MSVTLKLADDDAVLVARILNAVAGDTKHPVTDEAKTERLNEIMRASVISSRSLIDVKMVASAFNVAYRANQR